MSGSLSIIAAARSFVNVAIPHCLGRYEPIRATDFIEDGMLKLFRWSDLLLGIFVAILACAGY
jgi:hypothetical protein